MVLRFSQLLQMCQELMDKVLIIPSQQLVWLILHHRQCQELMDKVLIIPSQQLVWLYHRQCQELMDKVLIIPSQQLVMVIRTLGNICQCQELEELVFLPIEVLKILHVHLFILAA